MDIKINKYLFDNGKYTINNDCHILLFSKYIKTWYNTECIDNLFDISENEINLIKQLKNHNFNDNNCIVLVCNITGDEYLYIWDFANDIIYDLDCNDNFEINNNRGIHCLVCDMCYPVLIGYNIFFNL